MSNENLNFNDKKLMRPFEVEAQGPIKDYELMSTILHHDLNKSIQKHNKKTFKINI